MITGLVVNSFGRNFIVEVHDIKYQAITKSKNTDYVVGDYVTLDLINNEQAQIIDLVPRKNLVFRSDRNRSKIIASNISQIVIVIALKPSFNIYFLNSCLIFAESENISPVIVINKIDLPDSQDFIDSIEELYFRQLGYHVICLSAINDCSKLTTLFENHRSLLIGQSGVGKSTITNQVIPDAMTQTNNITKAETSGKHTTTNATLYHINRHSDLIDCPGLHEFGLYHLQLEKLAYFFPECHNLIGKCRFRNCIHLNEPECAIINAYIKGTINKHRFDFLQNLTIKLQNKN
ncbi:MAG: ribosome small subunit-dependent GTPase A [Neisseriaceae bacterium]